jgi:hypothetical protein
MDYHLIQPPFTLNFAEMSRHDRDAYFQWFMGIMPERIGELQRAINATPGFEAWRPDCSPVALTRFAEWFSMQVETRRRTTDELASFANNIVPAPDWELTNRTFSIAMDAGMYFGTTLQQEYPHLCWEHSTKSKRDADYGQAILTGFGRVPLNSVRIMVMLAYGIAAGKRGPERLLKLWDYWSQLAATHSN